MHIFLHLHWQSLFPFTDIFFHFDWRSFPFVHLASHFWWILIAFLKQAISYDFTSTFLMCVSTYLAYMLCCLLFFQAIFLISKSNVMFLVVSFLLVPYCLFRSCKGVGDMVHCFLLEVIELSYMFKLNTSNSCILLFAWRDKGMLQMQFEVRIQFLHEVSTLTFY